VQADAAPHIGKIYDDGGPIPDYGPVCAGVQWSSGRTIQYVNVPPQVWESSPRETRLPDHLIAHLVTMGELHREDRDDRMTDSFQQLAGRAPIPAAEFVRRHATALTPQAGS